MSMHHPMLYIVNIYFIDAEMIGCLPSQFECSDGTCLDEDDVCDNDLDCPIGEDELDCGKVYFV